MLRYCAGLAVLVALMVPATTQAGDLPCSDLGKIKSLNADHPIDVTFRNRSGEDRVLFWLNYQGKPVISGMLRAGESMTQHTFVTHPWVVGDVGGNCLDVLMPPDSGTVTIGARH